MAVSYMYDPAVCEIEPIHRPDNVQPHGVLLALDAATLTVLYTSDNTAHYFGIEPQALLGETIGVVIGEHETGLLRQRIDSQAVFTPVSRLMTLIVDGELCIFQTFAHHNGQFLVLEFEPDDGTTSGEFLKTTHDNLTSLRASATVVEACRTAAEAVRALSGHDRVLVYHFDEIDQHGIVLAESRTEEADSFLGLHYPMTDIPSMARDLFLINGVRLIMDATYEPARLMAINPDMPALDLTQSLLRGVSNGHLQYLENMGVRSSMSIAIVKNGRLWGLFACHHHSPHFVSRHVRDLCRFLGMVFSAQIGALEDRDNLIYAQTALGEVQTLTNSLRLSQDVTDHLRDYLPQIQHIVNAEGVAVVHHNTITTHGLTPDDDQIRNLAEWLYEQYADEPVFQTHRLPDLYEPAYEFAESGSGVLASALSPTHPSYILWFRPEIIYTVTWGRQIEQLEDSPPLTPGDSFRQWKQSVKYSSERWRNGDITAARELRTQITDLRAQNALAQSERQLRAILNTLPSVVFVYRNDEIMFINETAPLLTAYSRDELLQGKLWDVIPLETKSGTIPEGLHNHEMRIVRKDGIARWIYINTLPITFQDQPMMVGTAFDITEKKEAMQRTLEMEIERQQIQILAEFIQDVSHDLRTPISVLMTSLFLLKRNVSDDQLDRIEMMETQTQYLIRLIDDLVTMSRLDHKFVYEFQPLDINRLLLSVKTRMQSQAETKNQHFYFDLDMRLPMVRGDNFELERCFVNILENAISYTDEGGRVIVRTAMQADSICVSIEDNGVGISEEDLPNIFKRFYRANKARNTSGTGLGLSIVHKIVEAHRGSISVTSTRGEGTKFEITLPYIGMS